MVEQREQQENTMENSQLNTIRNTLRKYIIWFNPLFNQNDKKNLENFFKTTKTTLSEKHLKLSKI